MNGICAMETDDVGGTGVGSELAVVVGACTALAVVADGVAGGMVGGVGAAVAKSERQTKAVPWKEKLAQAALTEGDRVLFGKSGESRMWCELYDIAPVTACVMWLTASGRCDVDHLPMMQTLSQSLGRFLPITRESCSIIRVHCKELGWREKSANSH